MVQKKISDICLIIELFQKAFFELKVSVPPGKIEALALRVHRTMDGRYRHYHGPMHMLDLASGEGPIVALAAIYHDIIQYQIDNGAPPLIEKILSGFIEKKGSDQIFIKKRPDPDLETDFKILTTVFGYSQGQKLIQSQGLNEFLSSVVCIHELKPFLKQEDLIEIICCIEGTVPFRTVEIDKETYSEKMAKRILDLFLELNIKTSKKEIDDLIHLVVHLGNKDVKDFATKDPIAFIKNTWSILPESNQALLFPLTVTMNQYRVAFSKMEAFLSSLDPGQIFHSYKNIPSSTDLKKRYDAAEFNLNFAVKYLRIHLFEISILEAIALETGGMTVLSLFEGDPTNNTEKIKRIEDFLPKLGLKIRLSKIKIDKQISKSLNGRYKDKVLINRFYSPVAACLYDHLGDDIVDNLYSQCLLFFDGNLSAFDYLKKQSFPVIHIILKAICEMAPIRKEPLISLIARLKP